MATIFDGYAKAPDEQIADQIALLETITLGNVMKPYGQKIHRGAVKSVKAVGALFGKKLEIENPEVKEVQQAVEENLEKLIGLTRNELDARLRKLLCDRSGCTSDASDDFLSAKVTDRAGALLKISAELTPAQKADRVWEKFNERVLENFQKELKKRNPEHVAQEFDIKLHEMSDEQRQKIQEILKVDKLTGESMRAALVRAGAPALILGAVAAAGFGGFIAISTIIHAVFTTILGITLPFAAYTGASSIVAFITGPVGWLIILGIGSWQMIAGSKKIDQEMLAQCVWFAVGTYGHLTPADEKLPSWVPQTSRGEIDAKDKAYAALVSERDKAVAEAESSANQLKNLQGKLSQSETSLEVERHKRQSAERARIDLEARQSHLDESRSAAKKRVQNLEQKLSSAANASEEMRAELSQQLESARTDLETGTRELENNKRRLKEQDDIIDYASREIISKEEQIESMQTKNIKLQSENEELKLSEQRARAKAEDEEKNRRKQIESLWHVHFVRFKYQPTMLSETAKLSFKDRCALEKVLRELHDARDPHAISSNRGKLAVNGNEHIRVDLAGSQWRVEYKINKNQEQPIELIKLYKKGQHYMD